MRIIGGSAKGRRLKGPAADTTRPMTDRAREGLFSALASVVPGARVLDLYAGSGSLGLEALSRGAASATFVENDRTALAALAENVARVGLGGTVDRRSVEQFMRTAADRYDLAFIDPPYARSLASVSEIMCALVPRMETGATLVLHRRAGEDRLTVPGLDLVWERAYGTTQLWRYEKETG